MNLISQSLNQANYSEGIAIPAVVFPGRPCWIPEQEMPRPPAEIGRYYSPAAVLRREAMTEMARSNLIEKALFAILATVSIFAVAYAVLGTEIIAGKYEIFLQTLRALIG